MKFGNNLKGHFKLVVRDKDGNVKEETQDLPNQITIAGITRWASSNIVSRYSYPTGNTVRSGACGIGTGNSAPLVTNTSLDNMVASQRMPTSVTYSNSGSPDYIGRCTCRFDFAIGTLNGNFSEIGIGFTDTYQGGFPPSQLTWQGLFCRALIKDGNGNPTTITVLSDETLEVYYTIENTIPLTDATSTVVANGVERNVTIRSLGVGNTPATPGGVYSYAHPGPVPLLSQAWSTPNLTQLPVASSQSTLNAITSTTVPSGANPTSQTVILSEEIPGVGWRKQVRYVWGTSLANQTNSLFVLGINSLFQVLISPGLVKTSLDTMTLDVTYEVYIV